MLVKTCAYCQPSFIVLHLLFLQDFLHSTVCFFYAPQSKCSLDTLISERNWWLMSHFLHYVRTFDKQKRNEHFFNYIHYNVAKTEVGWIHQKEILAHFIVLKSWKGKMANLWPWTSWWLWKLQHSWKHHALEV